MDILSETIQTWSNAGLGKLFILSSVVLIVVFIVYNVGLSNKKEETKPHVLGLFWGVVLIFAFAFVILAINIGITHLFSK